MKKAELDALGLTKEQYEAYFGELPEIEDDVVETVETVETPAFAEETPVEETPSEVAIEETPDVVPATVEPATAAAGIEFKNMKAAADFLAEKLNLKVTNTLDCLYKCLKAKNHKTHKYAVERREDNTVVLTPLA